MDTRQHGEMPYWEAVAEAVEDIDFNGGWETFLDSFLKIPHWLRLLVAADWCQKEICNGGTLHFFTNSTGIFAPEAVEGFHAIGLPDCAALLEEGVRIRDGDTREEFGERFPGEKRSEWDPFYALDEKFFLAFGSENARFEDAAQAYFVKQTRN